MDIYTSLVTGGTLVSVTRDHASNPRALHALLRETPVTTWVSTPTAEGERGQIVIAGPNVSVGYLHRPDLTASAFFERDGVRAYRTGDWGRYRGELLYFEGRIDQQIKLHGYRIELGEIESELRAGPGVRDAVVVPVLRDGRPSALSAALLTEALPSDAAVAADEIRRRLRERLPSYMIPRYVRFFTHFPLTANGKVDRRALAAMASVRP